MKVSKHIVYKKLKVSKYIGYVTYLKNHGLCLCRFLPENASPVIRQSGKFECQLYIRLY